MPVLCRVAIACARRGRSVPIAGRVVVAGGGGRVLTDGIGEGDRRALRVFGRPVRAAAVGSRRFC